MKLKEGFILRSVAGETVVIPTGDDLDLNMMITLNDTGKFLWERLEKGAQQEELVEALLQEYDVAQQTAVEHVDLFIGKLEKHGFIE